MGEREVEDYKGSRLLGRGAAGGRVGQVDASQRDPVCQGCFSGHHQAEVAMCEALDSRWDKERLVRALGLSAHQHRHGDGLVTISV